MLLRSFEAILADYFLKTVIELLTVSFVNHPYFFDNFFDIKIFRSIL